MAIKRVSSIWDAQVLGVFNRELWVSVCLSPLLPTPFIGLS